MKQTLKHILAVYKVKRSRHRAKSHNDQEVKYINKHFPAYSDDLFFAGISKEGFAFITRLAFRSNNKNENWLALNIPGKGIWSFENLSLKEGEGFKQGKLEYRCIEAGEKWQIKFDGKLYQDDKELHINMDVIWNAATPLIQVNEFGTSDLKLGKQISQQRWNFKSLQNLNLLNQLNYEQTGKVAGIIDLNGDEHKLDFIGIRNHHRGINNWKETEQHYWISGFLENGYYLSIRLVDYRFLKNYQTSFIYDTKSIHKIVEPSSLSETDINNLIIKSSKIGLKQENEKRIKQLTIEPLTTFSYRVNEAYVLKLAEAAFTLDGVNGIGIIEVGNKLTN